MTISNETVKQVFALDNDGPYALPFAFEAGVEGVIALYMREEYNTALGDSDVNTTTNRITPVSKNWFVTDDKVTLTTDGASLPSPLVVGTEYYAIKIDEDTLELSATKGGSAISLTNTGSSGATITITPVKPRETKLTLTTHYTLDSPATTATIVAGYECGAGQQVIVIRETGITQATDYISTTAWAPLTAEIVYDKLSMICQELGEKVDRAIKNPMGVDTSLNLVLPEPVANKVIGWNSDADGLENLDPQTGPTGARGSDGNKGDKGDPGDPGDRGPTGPTGPQPSLCSQAQAEAGTDNTLAMSPLRTLQSITANPHPNIATNASNISTNSSNITANSNTASANTQRIIALEDGYDLNRQWGKQLCENNVGVAVSLLGNQADASKLGVNSPLQLNQTSGKSARIDIEIYREDDAEVRASRIVFLIHYINGAWYMAEESRTVLAGNPDGVTFSFTDTAGVFQMTYTTDNMSGGNYVEGASGSYIHWMREEISTLTYSG